MTFRQPGIFTSIQDMGRFGFRRYGVPVSGAMDHQSAGLANLLTDNKPGEPVVEITLSGPEIHFDEDIILAITGADLTPQIDTVPIAMNTALQIKAGQVLAFGKPKYGTRAYLALKGGFDAKKTLNSYAQYFPVTPASRIEKDFEIGYRKESGSLSNAAVKQNMEHFLNDILEVTPGPEYELLAGHLKKLIPERKFRISENNRMGYQLSAEHVPENNHSMITAPVIPGTVQLTPSGKLIVLMRDGQVTGGYPRILQLTEDSINRLAQKSTGQSVKFQMS